MKNKEIIAFWKGLNGVSGQNNLHRRLNYGIARNIDRLKNIIAALEEISKNDEEFEKKRVELAQKYAKKDDDGNPKSLPGNQGVEISDMIAFNNAVDELKDKTGQRQKEKEIAETLEADESLDVYMVPYSCVVKSKEQLNGFKLQGIMPMLMEPTDEDFFEGDD
jgi:hypothetical protein